MKIRNYKPEIRAVLSALIAEGFSIAYVDDGEDSSVPAGLDVAVETVASVDVATAVIIQALPIADADSMEAISSSSVISDRN